PPHLFPPDSALPSCPQLHLDAPTAARVLHGNTFHYDVQSLQPETTLARVYNAENKFIAIATWNAHHQYWQPVKVFN
ncbi:MAG: tRNA pseudouridine(55) synthase TruB, partial [Ktedonobacteraceae bacterium]|nr:tRNA pseudouridine(55) synthase TruB [Ktedonobacteraceae bacterium]